MSLYHINKYCFINMKMKKYDVNVLVEYNNIISLTYKGETIIYPQYDNENIQQIKNYQEDIVKYGVIFSVKFIFRDSWYIKSRDINQCDIYISLVDALDNINIKEKNKYRLYMPNIHKDMGIVEIKCIKEISNTRIWNECLYNLLEDKNDTIEDITPPLILAGSMLLLGFLMYFYRK